MDSSEQVRQRIAAKVGRGQFLANLLHAAVDESADVQSVFVRELSKIALTVRRLLDTNGLVSGFDYRPTQYWPRLHGKRFAFLDGGVASIDLPSAAPIGIRVGSYVVAPGDTSPNREQFQIELSLVDDLYSDRSVSFDSDFEDLSKMRDAARIMVELAAALRVARLRGAAAVNAIFIHGPLVNPVAPYGSDEFPSFTLIKARELLDEPGWEGASRDRQFVSLYRLLLERLKGEGVLVLGSVERAIGNEPVVLRALLAKLVSDELLSEKSAREIVNAARTFGLNDSSIFDVVLGPGEYLSPIEINRQGARSKWPEEWKSEIDSYPSALTTYLKPAEAVAPFRIEGFADHGAITDGLELLFHTARLLPSYGFPVGLDIVDKFAKVPSWLARGVRGQHSVVLLKKAIESGDSGAITFAKRVLAARARDWFFRPTA